MPVMGRIVKDRLKRCMIWSNKYASKKLPTRVINIPHASSPPHAKPYNAMFGKMPPNIGHSAAGERRNTGSSFTNIDLTIPYF